MSHQTVDGLLNDMIEVQATDFTHYTVDVENFIRSVAVLPVDERHRAKRERRLQYLQRLGPIPFTGSCISRQVVRLAISLGIKIQVLFHWFQPYCSSAAHC